MNWNEFINELIKKMGFKNFNFDFNAERQQGLLFIYENENFIKENLPALIENINKIVQLVAKKHNIKPIFVDINNYKKEREKLIIELVKAAARRAALNKEEIHLPPMNSYERRIAHLQLISNPEVTTESRGKGKNRFVVIKPIINS